MPEVSPVSEGSIKGTEADNMLTCSGIYSLIIRKVCKDMIGGYTSLEECLHLNSSCAALC